MTSIQTELEYTKDLLESSERCERNYHRICVQQEVEIMELRRVAQRVRGLEKDIKFLNNTLKTVYYTVVYYNKKTWLYRALGKIDIDVTKGLF